MTGSYLLVLDAASRSVRQVPLAHGAAVTLGGPGADVVVAGGGDADARVTLDGDEARIEPLGAGDAQVNGEPLRGARLLTGGDVVTLGGASVVFHRDATGGRRALVPLRELLRRLEEEAERSLRYDRPLTVASIALGAFASSSARDAAADAAMTALRIVDVVAWGGDSELLVVMPETGGAARVPAERVLRAIGDTAPTARCGLVVCPDDASDLDTLLAGAREAARAAAPGRVATLDEAASSLRVGDDELVVVDPGMKRLFSVVERLAASDLPVLVRGETGVGKEVVAAALHAWSPRSRARMVAINCAAVPEPLLESQLFGHERGAFSGAVAAKPGLFEVGAGGTVFLDEVGELTLGAQAKLLRVLETKTVSRVGAVAERIIDVRVIAATNRPLEAELARGTFRQDLFFRLCAATVFVPPLRDRRLDLPALARAFLIRACEKAGRPVPALSPSAMVKLARYPWPGNVRELRNAMAYVAATHDGAVVDLGLLPELVSAPPPPRTSEPSPAAGPSSSPARRRSGEFRNIYDEIRDLERVRMEEALEAAGGVRVRAAELIGMPLRTFVTKLKEHGIPRSAGRMPAALPRREG